MTETPCDDCGCIKDVLPTSITSYDPSVSDDDFTLVLNLCPQCHEERSTAGWEA